MNYNLEMEAEELDGRKLTIDSIMNKVRDIKNKINEDLTDELSSNKICAETTGEFFFSLKSKQTNKTPTILSASKVKERDQPLFVA